MKTVFGSVIFLDKSFNRKIDETALRVILNRMPDGFLFAHKILSIILGDQFLPVVGTGEQGRFVY